MTQQTKIPKGALVKVSSGDRIFEGFVEMVEWDYDQWAYLIFGEWFCQSEVQEIKQQANDTTTT